MIGRLREPLIKPNENEREGYVPNVVYSCGALLHNGELIIPYGLADHATGFATVPLEEVLAAMQPECSSFGDQAESCGPVAGSLANAAAAVWRLGNGRQQHRRRAGRARLGCDIVRHRGFGDHAPSLHAVVDRGYEEDRAIDPKVAEYLHISEVFEHAAEFDLIHSHYDFMALTYTRLVKTPVLTTIHGFSSPRIMPVYEKYRDGYFVSISDSDRAPGLNYLATVYNGIDLALVSAAGIAR